MTSSLVTAVLQRISPALVNTGVYSCFSIIPRTCSHAAFSSSALASSKDCSNKDFKPNPLFENRNPRNLEQLGLARKRQGWVLQAPRKDFYHRVVFERTNRNTIGRVEHFSGKTVVTASTVEWAIKDGLYSLVDVSAAENVGRVLGQRCMECGITNVFHQPDDDQAASEKVQAFVSGLQESGVCLEEPELVDPQFVPGVDYSRPHRVGEKKKWQDDYQPL